MGEIVKLSVLAAPFGAALALVASAPAAAALVISYSYSGTADVGEGVNNVNTVTPTNTATRFFGGGDCSECGTPNRASLIHFGSTSHFVFAGGAAAQGYASAQGTLTLTVDITNDTGSAQEFSWQGLIFSGGVGFAYPDLGDHCTTAAIESCASYAANPFSVDAGEIARLQFAASLSGVDIFSGDIRVDSTGASSLFNGIALNGFGAAAGNADFFSWQETNFARSLGIFAAGETRTLQFVITATTAVLNGFCSESGDADCVLALAGFGDPPGGDSGGVSQNGGGSARALAFTFIGPTNEVPLPPAALLFGAALLAAGGRRALRRRATGQASG